jgi:hypothetical protein
MSSLKKYYVKKIITCKAPDHLDTKNISDL